MKDDTAGLYIRGLIMIFAEASNSLLVLIPSFRFLPTYRRWLNSMHAKRDDSNRFFLEKIRESIQGDDQENFVKEYVDRVGSDYDQMELVYILRDFIAAGTVTTATTLCWAIVLLGNNVDVQKRLHTELDDAVPRDRLPSMDDKAKRHI